MTATASILAAQAEAILNQLFAQLHEPKKYIASFRTKTGKHIALTRQS